jgi:hypothetical protein
MRLERLRNGNWTIVPFETDIIEIDAGDASRADVKVFHGKNYIDIITNLDDVYCSVGMNMDGKYFLVR